MSDLMADRFSIIKNGYTFLDHQQIPTMTDVELQEEVVAIKTQIIAIENQLEKFRNGWSSDFTEVEGWQIRAIDAKRHLSLSRSAVRLEVTKRRLAKEAEPHAPKETPEQKAARIAATDANQIEQSRAFVRAAFRILSKREFDEIWDFARELVPEAFLEAPRSQ